jgi:hypothetical protein
MSYLSEGVFPRAPKDHSFEIKDVTVSIYADTCSKSNERCSIERRGNYKHCQKAKVEQN